MALDCEKLEVLREQNKSLKEQNELLRVQNDTLKKQLHVAEQTQGWVIQIATDLRKKP